MEAATLSLPQAGLRSGPEATDDELVSATRAGDDRAFELLYGRYQRRISVYVLGMVKDHGRAEDVTQEVFVSALRRMRQTDRPLVFKPWIYEIAKNACIDQFRRTRRTSEDVSYDAEEGVGPTIASNGPTPDAALEGKQRLDDLCGAFGGLSEAHHRILVMRELEGLTYAEIGERLGMTKPSVESTLFRARKRLSEEYDELVSGERCRRVQAIIAGAESRSLGARDQRRMARHVSHCQACRRAAALAGLGDVVPLRTGMRAKLAGLLPLPALLRDRLLGLGGGGGGGGGSPAALLFNAAPVIESGGGGWAKAMATAATVAVAGVGANAVSGVQGPAHGGAPSAAALVGSAFGADGEDVSRPVAQRAPAATRVAAAAPPVRGGGSQGRERGARKSSGAGAAGKGKDRGSRISPTPTRSGSGSGTGSGSATAVAVPPATNVGTSVKSAPSAGADPASGSSARPPAAAPDPVSGAKRTAGTTAGGTVGNAVSTVGAVAPPPPVQAPSVPDPPAPPAPVGNTPTPVPLIPEVVETVDQTVQQVGQAVDGLTGGRTAPVTDALENTTSGLTDTLLGG